MRHDKPIIFVGLMVVMCLTGFLAADPTGDGCVYHVDVIDGNDLNDGLAPAWALATIQRGIQLALNGDTVLVHPGVYVESINFLGKAITVRSAADAAILQGADTIAVSFHSNEQSGSVLEHFVICNTPLAIFCTSSAPTISQVTIADCDYGIACYDGAAPWVTHSILWDNLNGDVFQCSLNYSCTRDPNIPGQNNIYSDPLFADSAQGDYHLCSQQGRFEPTGDTRAHDWGEPRLLMPWQWMDLRKSRPFVSRDGRRLYYGRRLFTGQWEMVEAYRDVPIGPFISETVLTELQSEIWGPYDPWLSSDGLRMYYSYQEAAGQFNHHIRMAQRADLASPWVLVRTLLEISTPGSVNISPSLTDDERTIFWASDRPNNNGHLKIWKATRPSVGDSFSNIAKLAELAVDNQQEAPCVLLDGLTLYFTAVSDQGQTSLYKASRNSLADPFDQITPLDSLNQYMDGVSHPYVTPDQKELYFYGQRFPDGAGFWVSHFEQGRWVMDHRTSPCVDAGDPWINPAQEPVPNGGRINIGAYGNTAYASRSTWPITGDLNHDGILNLLDLSILATNWMFALPWIE